MASNNTGFPYQRPQHPNLQNQNNGQTFPQQQQNGYAAQRWPDYDGISNRSQQHQHHDLAMGNSMIKPTNTVRSSNSRASVGVPATTAPAASRTATASPVQNSAAFSGYGQYIASHVQHYQSQTPTSTAETVVARGYTAYPVQGYTPTDRSAPPEYFDYATSPTTSAQAYTSLYQTTDTPHQQTTSAQSYTPVYQTAEPAREVSSAAAYPAMYQTAEETPAPSYPRQYQPPQRTTTPSTQFQPVNQLQQYSTSATQAQQYSTPAAPVQQYDAFPSPTQQGAATSHTTAVPTTTYSQPPTQPKPKAKPKPKTKSKPQDGGLVIKAWNGPPAAPPAPRVVQYEDQGYYAWGQDARGVVPPEQQGVRSEWTQAGSGMQRSSSAQGLNVVPSQPQGNGRPGGKQQQGARTEQSWTQAPVRPVEQVAKQTVQTQTQIQTQPAYQHTQFIQSQAQPVAQVRPVEQVAQQPVQQTQPQNQARYTGQHTQLVQPQPQAQAQSHQLPAQYMQQSQAAPHPYPEELEPQREPEQQYLPQREPEPQYPPQPAPQPQHDSPQPRAPSEPRPAPPLNKDLMEQQMKVMVERMRYYQAADPVTFQQVWEAVRKSAQPTITAGSSVSNNSGEEEQGRRAIMGGDGSEKAGSLEGTPVGEEATMVTVFTHSQTPDSGQTQATAAQSQQVEAGTQRTVQAHQHQHQSTAIHNPQSAVSNNVPAQPAPVPTSAQPPRVLNPPPHVLNPPTPTPSSYHDAQVLKTAKAVSKYLIKTSGHCLPEEIIMGLLGRIKSFPVLCDKLEEMGYKFHRGNFSRFLLAEVDGDGAEEAPQKEEVEDGGSRVLGEVEDDQEQVMREAKEAQDTAHAEMDKAWNTTRLASPAPLAEPSPAKRGRGRPRKPNTPGNASLELRAASDVPVLKTPTVPAITLPTALPTPMSAAPTASMAGNPTALLFGQQQPPPPPSHLPPSPADYIPRHPTPQSVKAAHAAPPKDSAGEMKQFVSPSLVYRPPTPPPMVVDVNSSPSPPPPEMYSPPPPATATSPPPARSQYSGLRPKERSRPSDVEMRDVEEAPVGSREQPGEVNESPQSAEEDAPEILIVKFKLPTPQEPVHDDSAKVPSPLPPPIRASKAVMIDLTSSATPEPQIHRAPPPPPASAPQFQLFREKERQLMNSTSKIIPPPLMAPNSAPAKQNAVPAALPVEPRLYEPIQADKALKKLQYDPVTIARDILIATGRNPSAVRPLNAHLNILQGSIGFMRLVNDNADLETIRWDILDPGPVEPEGFGGDDGDMLSDGGFGGMADDEGAGGVGVAVARAPVMFGNPAAAKAAAEQVVAPSPTPAARGRHAVRGGRRSILGASVESFRAESKRITAASDSSNGSGARTPQRQAAPTNAGRSNGNGNSHGNTGGGSWGGFVAPAPRSGSRTGSGLRNVVTPDVGASNFAVVIRSPSASSADRSRVESSNARGMKRRLEDSDKEKGTPVSKKPTKPAKQKGGPTPRVSRKKPEEVEEEEDDEDELKPSGFKVFKCKWKFCPAELHNFETLHRHVIKVHCKLASYGGYPCNWEGCSRSPTKEMKKAAAAAKRGPFPAEYVWDFDTPEKWEKHVVDSHLESIKNEIGVGPSVGPYDREAFGSDVDYLSDNQGRRVTPLARPAPPGYVFLPPPGYQWQGSRHNQFLARTRALGAGMEGDETADLRENDDEEGVFISMRRIVAAADVSVGLLEGGSRSASDGVKEKSKNGKGKDKETGGSDDVVPGSVGAFTVHKDEEYSP